MTLFDVSADKDRKDVNENIWKSIKKKNTIPNSLNRFNKKQ